MKDKNIFYKEFKMRDEIIIPIGFCVTILGVLSIIFTFLLLAAPSPKPKSITDIKEVIINGEVYRKVKD